VEQLGPIEALRRSWQLTNRHVWRSVGYVVLLSILSAIVISLPLSVLQQFFLALTPFPMEVTFAISSAVGSIFSVIWQPLYAAGVVLLYYDLRVRQESYDLALRVEQLEVELRDESPQRF
jgi:membrane-anchored glycerophosphoryl diester phosphodiesterase (GDPDase)